MEKWNSEKQRVNTNVMNDISLLLAGAEYQGFCAAVEESLALLGGSVGVDKVTVWKSYEQDGERQEEQLYRWEVDEKKILEDEIQVSIYIGQKQWGFIGLGKEKGPIGLSEQEEAEVQTAGRLIALSIMQNQSMKELILKKEEAVSGNEVKSRFLANMSHEIRTPLNAIMGMTVIALKAEEHEKIEDCLQKINNASNHLLSIINDVLDVSKIEAQKFELAEAAFDFRKMIYNVQMLTASRAAENN